MPTPKKILVLVSGGQDSVTTLATVLHENRGIGTKPEVHAVSFDYNQRHGPTELASASKCIQRLSERFETQVRHSVIPLGDVFARISRESEEPINLLSPGDFGTRADGLPTSFVPGRNMIFLSVGLSMAYAGNYNEVWTGVCQTDYSGYPDCRSGFIMQMQRTAHLSVRPSDPREIPVITPLMYLSKWQTFDLAERKGILDIVLTDTMTCYNGDVTSHDWGRGCAACPACEIRAKGWTEYRNRKHL